MIWSRVGFNGGRKLSFLVPSVISWAPCAPTIRPAQTLQMQRYQERLVSLTQKAQVVHGSHGGAHSLVGLGLSEFLPFPPWPAPSRCEGREHGAFPRANSEALHRVNSDLHTWIEAAGFGEKCHGCLLTGFQGLPFFLSRAEPIFGDTRSPAGLQGLPSAGPVPSLPRTGFAFLPPPGSVDYNAPGGLTQLLQLPPG